MALTPEQASQLVPSDYEEVQRLEKELDAKLLANYNVALQRFDFSFFNTKETKRGLKVIFELQRRYQIAGWTVTLMRDGEDCSGLVLVAPNAPAVLLQPPTVHQRLMAKDKEDD